MKRLRIAVHAVVDLDDDAAAMLEAIKAETPGAEEEWLGDKLQSERGVQVQEYELTYEVIS